MPNNAFIRTLWDVKVPMRDGIKLSADIFLPSEAHEEPYPAILMRTPYATEVSHVAMAQFFAINGYVYAIQDTRGRLDSEGVPRSYPIFNEGSDGFDTIEWLANQSWCNGKIGMMGGSYRAWVQWAAAREHPPHLKTIVSTAASDFSLHLSRGLPPLSILQLLHIIGGRADQSASFSAVDWKKVFYHLPLNTMDEAFGRISIDWKEWMCHPHLDDYWKPLMFTKKDFEAINLPILHITGWYDYCLLDALFFYEGMVNHSPASKQQYILIGPWDHAGTRIPTQILRGVDFSLATLMDMKQTHLEWFDCWLKEKDSTITRWKRTKYFVMGENQWVEDNSTWPPSDSEYLRYYLHSNGKANTLRGDGNLNLEAPVTELPDTYIYNPEDPVIVAMDFGGQVETPLDNRFILRRDDVLIYTSKPLEKQLLITGSPVVELYASSDCLDTDWFVTLANVYPDGRSISVGTKGLRARYRNSFETPELLVSEQIYKFTIVMDSTCILLKPRHQIRLSITSSAFPENARNQNTGNNISEDIDIKIAQNTVYHDMNYPSCLLLPIK